MMRQFIQKTIFFAIVLLCSCQDAPRDNPLDPSSPAYSTTTSVTGHVYLLDVNTILASAEVRSLEDGISVLSDANGSFSFKHLTVGTQTLVCMKENFVPDTQHVVLKSGSSIDVSFYLNGAPYVLSQNIYTRKIDQYFPSPQYFVDITASVTDPNGITDIDSVWFTIIYAANNNTTFDTLLFPMTYSVSTKLFQTTIYKYDLPTNTTQWLVNRPLHICSRDLHKAINYSPAFYVSRIIENTATPVYPTTNPLTQIQDTTGVTPVFQWNPPDVTFNYTYTIVLSDVGLNVVWTDSLLNSSQLQVTYPGNSSSDTLSAGEYVWTISVVDDFGNYSRSKGASFIVR